MIQEYDKLKKEFDITPKLCNYIDIKKENKVTKFKILILDDDESILYFLSSYLNAKNYSVITTTSSKEALEKLKYEEIDLVIFDLMLGSVNGLDIYRESEKIKSKLPVIFMTGLDNFDKHINSMITNYIKKPIDLLELINKIDLMLSKDDKENTIDYKSEQLGNALKEAEKRVSLNKKILIIDDDESLVNFIKSYIEEEYLVEVAYDGDNGIIKAIEFKPDYVLLDIMLPKVDGYRVLKTLKSNIDNFNAKIIVMSAKKRDESVVRAFEIGADDFISKPIDMEELELRLKRL